MPATAEAASPKTSPATASGAASAAPQRQPHRRNAWYDQTGLTQGTGTASSSYLRDPSGLLLSVSSSGSFRNGHDRLGSVTGSWTTANANLYR